MNRRKNLKTEAEYQKELQAIYQRMYDSANKEINAFYSKYASKEGISMAEAKKRADKLDMDAYERKAKQYVKEKNFTDKANAEKRLYNMTMKVNRLELLKANIGIEMVSGFSEVEKHFDKVLNERTLSETQRQAGILGKTVTNNAAMAKAIVGASFNHATFSDRIWMHQDLLKSEINIQLQRGLIAGKHSRVLAVEIRKRFDVSRSNAERLMRTELARVQIEAQRQSYIRNGYDSYEFLAEPTACSICRAMDGKVFPVKKMLPGDNAPPLHPNCRCSTAAYMGEDDFQDWLARVSGNPDDIKLLAGAKDGKISQRKNVLSGAKRLTSHEIKDCYKTTNPHYRKDRRYQENCQRCVNAYEARRRGYDVVAKPSPQTSARDTLAIMKHPKGWPAVYEKGPANIEKVKGGTAKTVKMNICERMAEYGNGARAIVRIRWQKIKSGHVFMAEQDGDKTRFVDPQSGEKDVAYYFDPGMIKPTKTRLLRVDDKAFTDLIENCCEEVES